MAMRRCKGKLVATMMKSSFGYWATKKLMASMIGSDNPDDQLCNRCGHKFEDVDHVMQCTKQRNQQQKSVRKLQAQLQMMKTPEPVIKQIMDGVKQYLWVPRGSTGSGTPHPTSEVSNILHDAVIYQNHIGWHHILWGQLFYEWLQAVATYRKKQVSNEATTWAMQLGKVT